MLLLRRRQLLAAGIAVLPAACVALQEPPPPGATRPQELTAAIAARTVNDVRRNHGDLPAFAYNHALAAAAQEQANAMAARDEVSHELGTTLRERVTRAGYQGAVGENVAGGQPTLEAAIASWMASPGHRSTLLSTRFVEFGLAGAEAPPGRNARYRTYWAMVAGGDFAAWQS